MNMEQFYLKAPLITLENGEVGYFITVKELTARKGHDEFFRKVSKTGKVGKAVFQGLTYDNSDKAWYAENYHDISHHSGEIYSADTVFIGFDF